MEGGWGNRYKIFLSKSQTCLIGGVIHFITLSPSKYSKFSTRFKIKEVREYEGIKIIKKSWTILSEGITSNEDEGNMLKHRGGRC